MTGKALRWERRNAEAKAKQYSTTRFPQDDLGQRAKAEFEKWRASLSPKQRKKLYAAPPSKRRAP